VTTWTTEPLGNVLRQIKTGSTPRTSHPEYFNGDVPWFTPSDIGKAKNLTKSSRTISEDGVNNGAAKLFSQGTVLVTCIGEIGRVGVLRQRSSANQQITALVFDEKVLPDYAYYWFIANRHQLGRFANEAVVPILNNERLQEVPFSFPADREEQNRIIAHLDKSDSLVRTRRYALELTDTFLPAAFLELFGDPAENPRAFDRLQLEGLFAHSRDGAKCGPFGSALKKHEYVAAGIPVWTMNNVGVNEFVEDGCLYITPQKFEELAAYDAQNGDILISRAGTVGRMAIVRTKHARSIIHSNIIRLSLNHAKILPIYFVALMTWFAPRIARLKRGQEDAYTFMSTGSLGELQIPLPPFPLQQRFATLVGRVECLHAVQREALRQAEHLFASLLHRAFSG
jgi:type I restriction enzyme S subunit